MSPSRLFIPILWPPALANLILTQLKAVEKGGTPPINTNLGTSEFVYSLVDYLQSGYITGKSHPAWNTLNSLSLSLLTDHNEGIVHIHAAKTIGGFADIGPCILAFHLFDLQALLEDAEPRPATVDRPPVFRPHSERRWIAFHWTQKLDGSS